VPSPTPLISSWSFVDGGGSTGIDAATHDALTPRLAALDTRLYAAWSESNGTVTRIRASVYSGGIWAPVDGGALNHDSTQSASAPALAVLNGELYAAWSESNGTNTVIHVSGYAGNDSAPTWTAVDAGGLNADATKNATGPAFAIASGKLYAAWSESNGTHALIRASVYGGNDSAPAWSAVDAGGLNVSTSRDATAPTLAALTSGLYAAWSESNGTVTQLRAKGYGGNDSSPAWNTADTGPINSDPTQNAAAPALVSFLGNLVVAWQEAVSGGTHLVHASVYGGDSTPSWRAIDAGRLNFSSARDALAPTLTVFGSKLIAAWAETNGVAPQIRVSLFNGIVSLPSWQFIDGAGVSGLNHSAASAATTPAFCALGSKLYGSWSETNGTAAQVRAVVGN
jgi:hypothetical protein